MLRLGLATDSACFGMILLTLPRAFVDSRNRVTIERGSLLRYTLVYTVDGKRVVAYPALVALPTTAQSP